MTRNTLREIGGKGVPRRVGLSFHRKANVVFREGLGCGSRTGYVVQFGELAAMIEGVLIREAMEHGSHPPRKALHFPNAPQAGVRVLVEETPAALLVESAQRPRQHLHIGNREVQPFGSGRRNDVRRVSSQE